MSQTTDKKGLPGVLGTCINNRTLIMRLAKNDFKNRFAGSYLGAVWAFVQPVVTVLMYYIVFDKIFQSRSEAMAGDMPIPYVLFLTAGLVPWFFFNEGIMNGVQALIQYNYLVKKVVFNIDVLPVIKVVAAGFIHVFFALVLLIVGCIYRYFPGLHTLQILYYGFCLFTLILAFSYLNAAVVVFFKDLQQILAIGLQLGMWATPVLWNIGKLPEIWQKILRINPMCYIIEGYRDSVCGSGFITDRPWYTLYFWCFTLCFMWIGRRVFLKLKVHFADVL